MSRCQEFRRWVEEDVIRRLEEIFEKAREECREARKPIERWRQQHEQKCREQECIPWCLCCNKWFCWIVTLLIKIIEWLVETICLLIVEILRIITIAIVRIMTWIVELVLCIVEKFCSYLIFAAAIALTVFLIVLLLTIAALALPIALPSLAVAGGIAAAALGLAKLLCELGVCRFLGVIAWAFKWAIVLGVVTALFLVSIFGAFIVTVYGGIAAALYWTLIRRGCPMPRLFSMP